MESYTDDRTLSQLAKEALDVQMACNLSGVVHGFSRSISRLRELYPNEGTKFFNQHPIVILWVDKLADLSGACSIAITNEAYSRVEKMADGIILAIEV